MSLTARPAPVPPLHRRRRGAGFRRFNHTAPANANLVAAAAAAAVLPVARTTAADIIAQARTQVTEAPMPPPPSIWQCGAGGGITDITGGAPRTQAARALKATRGRRQRPAAAPSVLGSRDAAIVDAIWRELGGLPTLREMPPGTQTPSTSGSGEGDGAPRPGTSTRDALQQVLERTRAARRGAAAAADRARSKREQHAQELREERARLVSPP
jgi:hypothetical protein